VAAALDVEVCLVQVGPQQDEQVAVGEIRAGVPRKKISRRVRPGLLPSTVRTPIPLPFGHPAT
jgi:hypothetical protein